MTSHETKEARIHIYRVEPGTAAFEAAVSEIFAENQLELATTTTDVGTFYSAIELPRELQATPLCGPALTGEYLVNVLVKGPLEGKGTQLLVAYESSPAVTRSWALRSRRLAPRRLVGFLAYRLRAMLLSPPEAAGKQGPTELVIDVVCARPGVGRRLMCEAEREAREAGASVLFLWAVDTAIPFYRRLGFRNTWLGCRDDPAIRRLARLADAYIEATGTRFADWRAVNDDPYYGPFLDALERNDLWSQVSGLYPMRYCVPAAPSSPICAPRRTLARSTKRALAVPLRPRTRTEHTRLEEKSEEEEQLGDEAPGQETSEEEEEEPVLKEEEADLHGEEAEAEM